MIVKGSANSISQRLAMPDGTSLTQVLLPIGTRMPVRATNGLRPLGTFSKQQQKHLPPIDKVSAAYHHSVSQYEGEMITH